MPSMSRVEMFLAVAQHRSFSGAARRMGVTGPALSKQVKALEDELGVRLLTRTTRHVGLTEAGALYQDRARRAMETLENAHREILDMKQSPSGRLKINAPMSFGVQLRATIAEFAKTYPDIELIVDFDDRKVDVIAEGYDVTIRVGALQDSTLIARKIADCPILLCASAEMASAGLPAEAEHVADYPAIIYTRNGVSNDWQFERPDGSEGRVRLQCQLSANNSAMMLEACLQGVGLALLPIFVVSPYLKCGDLVHVLPDHVTLPQRGIYAIYPQNQYVPSKVRLFIDALLEFGESLNW